MSSLLRFSAGLFYDNSILSGTKIDGVSHVGVYMFYDNSILSGTKIFLLALENY